jgi:hypothetical protein
MTRSLLVPFALVSALTLGMGCATTQIKKAPDLPTEPKKTLVMSYTVRVHDENQSLLDAIQNMDLGVFGEKSVKDVEKLLAEQGFAVQYDKTRTVSGMDGIIPRELAQLGGTWAHPETPVIAAPSFAADGMMPIMAFSANNVSAPDEYTAFVDIALKESVDFGVGPVTLWGHPDVLMSVLVFNPAGKLVFVAKSRGEGDGTPFVVNRAPDNLQKGFGKAFEELAKVEVETL